MDFRNVLPRGHSICTADLFRRPRLRSTPAMSEESKPISSDLFHLAAQVRALCGPLCLRDKAACESLGGELWMFPLISAQILSQSLTSQKKCYRFNCTGQSLTLRGYFCSANASCQGSAVRPDTHTMGVDSPTSMVKQ